VKVQILYELLNPRGKKQVS